MTAEMFRGASVEWRVLSRGFWAAQVLLGSSLGFGKSGFAIETFVLNTQTVCLA